MFLSGVKEIKLEKINNIFYKKPTPKLLRGWAHALIERKIISLTEMAGVQLTLQSSVYRSQRCSGCCLVLKSNRKTKKYKCSCGLEIDADLNAAMNHEVDLPNVPFWLQAARLNISGFLWKPEGFFDLAGRELESPIPIKEI